MADTELPLLTQIRVGARLNCSRRSRLDYGQRVVTTLTLLLQCREATVIYGENVGLGQRSEGCIQGFNKGNFQSLN